MAFFPIVIEKGILKFLQNHRDPQIVKAILRMRKKIGGIILPGFKLYYKALVMKSVI